VVFPRITVDSVKSRISFIQNSSTCFGPLGHNQLDKNGRVDTQIWVKIGI